jgi:hypothetical protein
MKRYRYYRGGPGGISVYLGEDCVFEGEGEGGGPGWAEARTPESKESKLEKNGTGTPLVPMSGGGAVGVESIAIAVSSTLVLWRDSLVSKYGKTIPQAKDVVIAPAIPPIIPNTGISQLGKGVPSGGD